MSATLEFVTVGPSRGFSCKQHVVFSPLLVFLYCHLNRITKFSGCTYAFIIPILINHTLQASPPHHPKGHGFKPLPNLPKNIQWICVPIPAHVGKSVNVPRHQKCLSSLVQRAWLKLSDIKESFRSVRNVNKLPSVRSSPCQ